MEIIAAKIKAAAVSEEKVLYRVFRQIDSDRSGSIDKAELISALEALNLDVVKADGIMAVFGEGGDSITFKQFKEAVKLGGGKSFVLCEVRGN